MTAPVLIAGRWREAHSPAGTFTATNPTTGEALPDLYPVSSDVEVLEAIEAGAKAATEARGFADLPDRIATFLDDYASRIEAAADALVEIANLETGLAA